MNQEVSAFYPRKTYLNCSETVLLYMIDFAKRHAVSMRHHASLCFLFMLIGFTQHDCAFVAFAKAPLEGSC